MYRKPMNKTCDTWNLCSAFEKIRAGVFSSCLEELFCLVPACSAVSGSIPHAVECVRLSIGERKLLRCDRMSLTSFPSFLSL